MSAPAGDAARDRVRTLAQDALRSEQPVAWFEALYREAGGDESKVPWADLAPHPALLAWTSSPGALAGIRTAVVVGCGLGHDAEHLAAKGLDVVAFDVSPTAIEWARRLHPASRVRYEIADAFALPRAWRGAFDLVVEVHTLQALPPSARAPAAAAIRSLLAPHGTVVVSTRVRDDSPSAPPYDETASGPPWPLGRAELARFTRELSVVAPFVETPDATDSSIVRASGVWRARPGG